VGGESASRELRGLGVVGVAAPGATQTTSAKSSLPGFDRG